MSIPDEIMIDIISYCNCRSILLFCQASKRVNQLCQLDLLIKLGSEKLNQNLP